MTAFINMRDAANIARQLIRQVLEEKNKPLTNVGDHSPEINIMAEEVYKLHVSGVTFTVTVIQTIARAYSEGVMAKWPSYDGLNAAIQTYFLLNPVK